MGIFDTTIYFTNEPTSIDAVGKCIQDAYGEKYKIKLKEKNTGVKKLVKGQSIDNVLVSKNAYHRLAVTVSDSGTATTESGSKEFYLNFAQAPSKGWMNFLRKETGAIGGIILRLIFGSADQFHSDIISEVEKKFSIQERKVSLKDAFKKK